MATKMSKLTVEMVNGYNRAQMLEQLEDRTALEVGDIRKMTSKQMRDQLLALAEPVPVKKGEKKPEVVVKKGEPVKLKGEKGAKIGQPCMCGCLDAEGKPVMTKGGRFLPGHDAKYHSKMNGGGKHAPKPCLCGCLDPEGKPAMTRGGKFLPGHDAKYHSRMRQEEKAAAEAKALPKVKKEKKATVKSATA